MRRALVHGDLWIEGAAGGGGHRSALDGAAAKGGQKSAAPQSYRAAHRRTQVAHRIRRVAEALIRALIYAGMDRAAVDERGFEVVRRIRENHSEGTLTAFKAIVREQCDMLLLDTEAALAAIPSMLSATRDPAARSI